MKAISSEFDREPRLELCEVGPGFDVDPASLRLVRVAVRAGPHGGFTWSQSCVGEDMITLRLHDF